MNKIVSPRVFRIKSSPCWGEVLEEFNAGTLCCFVATDVKPGLGYIVKMLLLAAEVIAFTLIINTKNISIKLLGLFRLRNTNRGVIDPKKCFPFVLGRYPLRISLSVRKTDQLKVVTIGILKVKSLDAFSRRDALR